MIVCSWDEDTLQCHDSFLLCHENIYQLHTEVNEIEENVTTQPRSRAVYIKEVTAVSR